MSWLANPNVSRSAHEAACKQHKTSSRDQEAAALSRSGIVGENRDCSDHKTQ